MLLRILLSNGRGLCQSFLCGFNMQVFDNFTINNCDTLPRFFNFFEGFDLTAGQIQLCCTWGKTFIRHGNLGGMDQCFSVKTQITALFTFCAQALLVFELVVNPSTAITSLPRAANSIICSDICIGKRSGRVRQFNSLAKSFVPATNPSNAGCAQFHLNSGHRRCFNHRPDGCVVPQQRLYRIDICGAVHFGTKIASAGASRSAAISSAPHSVSNPLIRMIL